MGQEFVIKSQQIEDKINQLLPSQGGFQAGVDFSASTTVIPIVDLTETAEGSSLRQDLQSALSLTAITSFEVSNGSSTIINTTGYFRVFGCATLVTNTGGSEDIKFAITDGLTTKNVYKVKVPDSNIAFNNVNFDFIVFLEAGDSLTCSSTNSSNFAIGCTRQLATLSGDLVNP